MWRPHLIKDIKKLKQLQRRATKYILNDYVSDYKARLTNLRLLPLMYIFEISDVLFFIKNLINKNPTNNFNINTYISFTVGNTRSCGVKLRHNAALTNKERHFYFNRISRLWNSLPIINLNLSINTIKSQLKQYLWKHFLNNYNPTYPCSLHYLCPCS